MPLVCPKCGYPVSFLNSEYNNQHYISIWYCNNETCENYYIAKHQEQMRQI
jgi:hypothetical protein